MSVLVASKVPIMIVTRHYLFALFTHLTHARRFTGKLNVRQTGTA
jgi:hypothetical protein